VTIFCRDDLPQSFRGDGTIKDSLLPGLVPVARIFGKLPRKLGGGSNLLTADPDVVTLPDADAQYLNSRLRINLSSASPSASAAGQNLESSQSIEEAIAGKQKANKGEHP